MPPMRPGCLAATAAFTLPGLIWQGVNSASWSPTKPEPRQGITDHQVKSAMRYCEIKEAELSRELAEMKAKSGKEPCPEEPPVVPWHKEPSYLAEKQRRQTKAANRDPPKKR